MRRSCIVVPLFGSVDSCVRPPTSRPAGALELSPGRGSLSATSEL